MFVSGGSLVASHRASLVFSSTATFCGAFQPTPERNDIMILTRVLPALFVSLTAIAWGQSGTTTPTQTPATAPAAAPAPDPPKWTIAPVEVSGLLDAYYSFNSNHPSSGFNPLRNFEVRSNQFSMNMTKLSFTHSADPIGFTLDLGFGRAWDVFHATDLTAGMKYIPQAYDSVKPEN